MNGNALRSPGGRFGYSNLLIHVTSKLTRDFHLGNDVSRVMHDPFQEWDNKPNTNVIQKRHSDISEDKKFKKIFSLFFLRKS